MSAVRRALILFGVVLTAAGVFWPMLKRLPLERLPSDFVLQYDGLQLYIPLVSSLLVSLLLRAVVWLSRQ